MKSGNAGRRRSLVFDLDGLCWDRIARILGAGFSLLALWAGLTWIVCWALGDWLLYGVVALLFLAPLNSIGHCLVRLWCRKRFRSAGFLAYVLGLHLLVLIIGSFAEKDFVDWAFEMTIRMAPLYGIIVIEFLFLDWPFGRLFPEFGAFGAENRMETENRG